jgi:hypothetical protein
MYYGKCMCDICVEIRLPECTHPKCTPHYDFSHRCLCWHTRWDEKKVDEEIKRLGLVE